MNEASLSQLFLIGPVIRLTMNNYDYIPYSFLGIELAEDVGPVGGIILHWLT
jgi:hypothetical protein